jgi:hypothetical protein
MHDLIQMAQDMLSHAVVNGDSKEILRRALRSLARDLARERFADTSRPRTSAGPAPGARDPSAAVQREVWVRDAGRCRFVAADGRRCSERRFIQFHHDGKPSALGGETVAPTCQACHNWPRGQLPARILIRIRS